jgi:hypothetical protein
MMTHHFFFQERFQSRGITPTYRVVQAEGASHAPTFSYQVCAVIFFYMNFMATGYRVLKETVSRGSG